MQQAYARGNLPVIRATLDSLSSMRRASRPGDLALDYTYQEAWLRVAIGDSAAGVRQLDLAAEVDEAPDLLREVEPRVARRGPHVVERYLAVGIAPRDGTLPLPKHHGPRGGVLRTEGQERRHARRF